MRNHNNNNYDIDDDDNSNDNNKNHNKHMSRIALESRLSCCTQQQPVVTKRSSAPRHARYRMLQRNRIDRRICFIRGRRRVRKIQKSTLENMIIRARISISRSVCWLFWSQSLRPSVIEVDLYGGNQNILPNQAICCIHDLFFFKSFNFKRF